jgi:hypothetical protein
MTNLQTRALPATAEPCPTLADDLLRGAEAISAFIFGDPRQRRKIYHMIETGRMPTFRLGSMLCARKSTLLRWIAEQESKTGESKDV